MKKILFSLLICGAMLSASAQNDSTTTTTTTSTHKYYYYPSSNVYFDEASGNYWYWDTGTSKWATVQTLPSSITVANTSRYPIEYTGNDPWKNNDADMKKYKVKKDGKMKMKSEKE